ncbi:MAG: DUF5677 domain-containing protein [Clostridiales bacterium]|nr:DUF5677 domain-containing protein [Clostridiales bacterium]
MMTKLEEVPILKLFRESVDACREALSKVEVREELTYHYAIVRVYSKLLVTSCSIYTLLANGFPDDAMALCRQLYENLVIIDTLLKGKQKNNMDLLERFMDAPAIMMLKDDYITLLYAFDHDANDQYAKSHMSMINKEIQKYLKKYKKNAIQTFKDYWWSGFDSFSIMAEHSAFPKGYIYSLLSDKVHMNAFGVFHYLDESEPGILLGATEYGKQQPLRYVSLFLYCSAGIIHDHYPDICPLNVIKNLKHFSDAAIQYVEP